MYRTIIQATELRALQRAGADVAIFDCRFSLTDSDDGRRTYNRGHLPGAIYAHLEERLSGTIVAGKTGRHPLPNPNDVAAWLGESGVGSETQVVAYDDASGAFAARLWWLLGWLGHDTVAVLDGGFAEWSRQGLPVVAERPQRTHALFEPRIRRERVIDADEIERWRQRDDRRVFDARGLARFSGEHEPIDVVAGHIPGARPLPFEDNIRAGRFAPIAELAQRYAAALEGVSASDSAVYCGSGVTACHDILAAEHAGFAGMRLYAGSWSEWIVEPSRPVATGLPMTTGGPSSWTAR